MGLTTEVKRLTEAKEVAEVLVTLSKKPFLSDLKSLLRLCATDKDRLASRQCMRLAYICMYRKTEYAANSLGAVEATANKVQLNLEPSPTIGSLASLLRAFQLDVPLMQTPSKAVSLGWVSLENMQDFNAFSTQGS